MNPSATTPATPARPRVALSVHLSLWLWRHGAWLPLCLLMLAAAAFFGAQGWALAQQRQALQAAGPKPSAAPVRAAPLAAPGVEELAALRHLLPPASDATAEVRRLVALTRPQLAWQRAEFQHSEDPIGGLLRVQVTVPVAGEYAAMRQALDRSLARMPHVALDQVQLQRLQATDTRLEARLRFSIWLTSDAPATPIPAPVLANVPAPMPATVPR